VETTLRLLYVAAVNSDMRLSVLKPQQAKWLIDCHARMSHQEEVIKDGWVKSGLASVMNQENKVVMAANECPCAPLTARLKLNRKLPYDS
jgi:hypothetical protein